MSITALGPAARLRTSVSPPLRWGSSRSTGIEPIGFWTTLAGPSNQTLTYLLKWDSLAEREQKWNAFQADPEWIRQRNATEAEKIIVERVENQFLAPTAYSALR